MSSSLFNFLLPLALGLVITAFAQLVGFCHIDDLLLQHDNIENEMK